MYCPSCFFYDGIVLDDQRIWLIATGFNVLIEIERRQLIDIDAVEGKMKAIPVHKSDRIRWSDLFDKIYEDSSCGMHIEWMDWMLEVYLEKIVVTRHIENSDLQNIIDINIYKTYN